MHVHVQTEQRQYEQIWQSLIIIIPLRVQFYKET